MKTIVLIRVLDNKAFEINDKKIYIGRTQENEIVLTSNFASRKHARLVREGDCVWLTDMGSVNGTFVNAARLAPNMRQGLAEGDEICFGQTERFFIKGCDRASDSAETAVVTGNQRAKTRPRFGFKASSVEFEDEDVGAEAAAKLTERFRPIQVLSRGGMGKIILVQEHLSGRFVAMKIMLERATFDNALVQQFVREAIITARLQHPHIIPVHDLGFLDGNQLYYTMSYIENKNLKNLIPRLDIAEKVRILRCAALAVDHAHSKGLWHRDLKPQNILVGNLGDTYVIDWGLVSVQPEKDYKLNIPNIVIGNMHLVIPDNLIDETAEAITAQSSMHANAGIIGTPLYMSPEQLANDVDALGVASDVWAFGIILFEAVTGSHPLTLNRARLSLREIDHLIRTRDMPMPGDINPMVPPELDPIFLKMVGKDPKSRKAGLREFIEETGQFLQEQGYAVSRFGPSRVRPAPGSAGEGTDPPNPELAALRAENLELRRRIQDLEKNIY